MVRSFAAGFIFTTSLPPTVLAGSIEVQLIIILQLINEQSFINSIFQSKKKSIRVLKSEEGVKLREKHQFNVRYLRNKFMKAGISVEHTPSHILPVFVNIF